MRWSATGTTPKMTPFGEVCSGCINPLTSKNNSSSVAVVGAGVHIGGGAVKEIRKFLDLAVRTVFVPSKGGNVVYEGLLPYLAPNVPEHPFLDVYPLMRSCTMANCSYDGIYTGLDTSIVGRHGCFSIHCARYSSEDCNMPTSSSLQCSHIIDKEIIGLN